MKMPYQNQMVDFVEVEPITSKEEWNEYQLENGDILLTKTVLVKIFKAIDIKLSDGTPLYRVNTQVVVKVKSVEG